MEMRGARVRVEINKSDDSSSEDEEISNDFDLQRADNESPITKKRRLETSETERKLSITSSASDENKFSSDNNSGDSDNENSATENRHLNNCSNAASSLANHGWADAMAKVLKSGSKKHLILAKAKKDRDIKVTDIQKSSNIEVVNEKGETVKEKVEKSGDKECEDGKMTGKKLLLEKKEKKLVWRNMGRTKPHIGDKEKERMLNRAATRGIVQLFNAVQQHQKTLGEKLKTAGNSEVKKEKILKSFTKGEFLDMLKGEKRPTKLNKNDTTADDKKTWDVLKDDFMMGATLKDWDKDSDVDD